MESQNQENRAESIRYKSKSRGMTRKQTVFVREYLQCWNATQAALKAGYSKKTAPQIGSALLKHKNIASEIMKEKIRFTANSKITVNKLLDELSKIAWEKPQAKDCDRLRAMELIGKNLGAWQGDVQRGTLDVNVTTKRLDSEEEVVARIKARLVEYERQKQLTVGEKDGK